MIEKESDVIESNVYMKQRDSNIELLRIVAMLLVLIVHADFMSLGEPTLADIGHNVWDASIRVFMQSLSIACVDIFVLISGWFGIKATLKGGCSFLFQSLFFIIGIYVIAIMTGHYVFSLDVILNCLMVNKEYWFVKSYLLLYILSPALNIFVNTATRAQHKYLLIGFFMFQTFYGWIFSHSVEFFMGGYSTISFIGLYLLARYIKIYRPKWSCMKLSNDVRIIIITPLLLTLIYILPPLIANINSLPMVLKCISISYIAPTTIITAVFFLLAFTKLSFKNHIVNWLAVSSYAAYLFHTHPVIMPYYKQTIAYLHKTFSFPLFGIIVIVFIVAVFIISVLADKVRILIWNKLLFCDESNSKDFK